MIICAFQACERILLELFTNKESAVFHEPVSKLVCRASIYHISGGVFACHKIWENVENM